MKDRNAILVSLTVFSFCLLHVFVMLAQADWEYSHFVDRLTREHRAGNDVDEWVERGSATVNASPHFEQGARLTAWAGEYVKEDDYEFAIASAVYLFEIPAEAQYIEILVRYRGEPHESYIEDYESVAGRVWIRNTRRDRARRGYDDKHADETRYGDTFALRSKRRSETIKIAAAGHVDDGFLEMHVVAQDGEQIDIEYVDISVYRKLRHIDKHHRYARSFHWAPWHRYTYLYFYDGPCYYPTNQSYYIRWSYPIYDHHYSAIRYSYGNYLSRYYTHYPHYYRRTYSNYRDGFSDSKPLAKKRRRLHRWSQEHETVRRQYARSRFAAQDKEKKQTGIQTKVRSVIEKHRAEQPIVASQIEHGGTVASEREPTGNRTRSNFLTNGRERTFRSRSAPGKPDSTSKSNRQAYSSDSRFGERSLRGQVRSNSESRSQLHNRSQTYLRRSDAASSQAHSRRSAARREGSDLPSASRSEAVKPNSSSQPQASGGKGARSTKTKSSDDDDEREGRSSGRANNSERIKRRRK